MKGRFSAAAILGAAALCGCAQEGIVLYDLKGNQWVWPYFAQAQPTVLAFWDTEHVECLDAFPALNALEHRDSSVQLVTVCSSADRRRMLKWLQYENAQFVVLHDPDARLARRLKVTSFPTYLFFDLKGREIGRYYDVRSVHNWFDRKFWLDKAVEVAP